MLLWTCCWCANSVCRGRRRWPWALSPPAAFVFLNWDVIRANTLSPQQVDAVAKKEAHELQRREQEYRGNRKRMEIGGRTVILVDDGLATGSTVRAAVAALRHEK